MLFSQETRYFILGDLSSDTSPDHLHPYESYVLPLSDPEDIAYARIVIDAVRTGDYSNTSSGLIAFASIDYAQSQINRNYLKPGAPCWSWEVSEFLGFGEIGAEALDGWPSFVEDNLDYWVNNLGQIGFWSYWVMGELPFGNVNDSPTYTKESSWFGLYNDEHWPWIYSEDLGYIWIYGLDPFNIWAWSDYDSTWYWMSEHLKNYQWRYNVETGSGDWVYYARDWTSNGVRWYYNYTTNSWEKRVN